MRASFRRAAVEVAELALLVDDTGHETSQGPAPQ
jgi:hypothetical protein